MENHADCYFSLNIHESIDRRVYSHENNMSCLYVCVLTHSSGSISRVFSQDQILCFALSAFACRCPQAPTCSPKGCVLSEPSLASKVAQAWMVTTSETELIGLYSSEPRPQIRNKRNCKLPMVSGLIKTIKD